jgi:DNA-binding transcriptional LysR family regulator
MSTPRELLRGAAKCVAQFSRPVFDAELDPPDLTTAPGRAAAWAGLGLHQLRYVLAAAEQGGFRRAARSLGVQQSAVSRRIHDLEARLGAQIFERGPNGVRLTAVGEAFVLQAQGAVTALDQAVDGAAEAARGDARIVRVGAPVGLGGPALDRLLARLLDRIADMRIELVEAPSANLVEALARGRLDVGFLPEAPKGLPACPAWRDRLALALPVDHRLASCSTVLWRELADQRVMAPRDLAPAVRRGLERRGLAFDMLAQDAGPHGLARLVALGQGCAIVPEQATMRMTGVAYRPIARGSVGFSAVFGRHPEKPWIRRLKALLPAG